MTDGEDLNDVIKCLALRVFPSSRDQWHFLLSQWDKEETKSCYNAFQVPLVAKLSLARDAMATLTYQVRDAKEKGG